MIASMFVVVVVVVEEEDVASVVVVVENEMMGSEMRRFMIRVHVVWNAAISYTGVPLGSTIGKIELNARSNG